MSSTRRRIFWIGVFAVGAIGLSVPFVVPFRKPEIINTRPPDALMLTEREIASRDIQARKGDPRSAMDLFRYYDLVVKDKTKADEFLTLAASHGDSEAKKLLTDKRGQ